MFYKQDYLQLLICKVWRFLLFFGCYLYQRKNLGRSSKAYNMKNDTGQLQKEMSYENLIWKMDIKHGHTRDLHTQVTSQFGLHPQLWHYATKAAILCTQRNRRICIQVNVFKDQEEGNNLPLTSQILSSLLLKVLQKDAIQNDGNRKHVTWNLKEHKYPPTWAFG